MQGDVMDAFEEQCWLESRKMEYDWHKHLTTLSAGLLVIIAGFVSSRALPDQVSGEMWLSRALCLLGGAVLGSMLAMAFSITYTRHGPVGNNQQKKVLYFAYRSGTVLVAVVLFFGGIAAFLYFASLNVSFG